MSKEHSPATSHGLTGELREAAAYYSSASDPNLRQQSELCKRAADLYEKQQQRFAKQTDYGIHLQRIIESICHGRDIPEGSKAEAAFHAEMAEKFLSARSETRLMPGQNIGNPGTLPPASYGQNAREDAGKIEDTRSAIRLFPMRRVVCAAIRNSTQDIICGPRHFDIHMRRQIAASQFIGWDVAEQGFVDQQGIFLTRDQAHPIAKEAGQIIRRCGGDESTLYSENLY